MSFAIWDLPSEEQLFFLFCFFWPTNESVKFLSKVLSQPLQLYLKILVTQEHYLPLAISQATNTYYKAMYLVQSTLYKP